MLDPYRVLNRTRRTRNDEFFIGEGRLVVQRMLESDFEMVSVVLGDHVCQSFCDQIPDRTEVLILERSNISELVGFEFHSGIVACARRRRISDLSAAESVLRRTPSTVVICPFTVLPDNLGSIARLCTGFGVDALIVGERSADPFSRRAVRVSMGNVLQLTVIEPESTRDTIDELKNRFGYYILAATGNNQGAVVPMTRPDERIAIVFGNETDGIDNEIIDGCDQQVSIEMSGNTDSLNVSNAAAVLLYQFTRVSG